MQRRNEENETRKSGDEDVEEKEKERRISTSAHKGFPNRGLPATVIMEYSYLQTDDLTILLALISATVFLLNNLYKPQPLVHPILLGRQSDVGRARNPNESAVYRNYGTGLLGRFPLRPSKDVHILLDFVRAEIEAPRTLWSTKLTNSHLQDRAAAFATALLRLKLVQPNSSSVLLLLNDCLEFIVADLALAAHSIQTHTLSQSSLLAPVLESHPYSAIITHAFLLPQLLELIYESPEHRKTEHTIVVVGDPSPAAMASVASNIKIHNFAELERQGFKVEKILSPLPQPSDVFTVSLYSSSSGQIHGAQLTHENLTAAVAAVRALLPLANALSPLDTILSAHSMSTPYGRAVAYSAIYENTSFATIPTSELYRKDDAPIPAEDALAVSTRKYPIPSPTILFIKPSHLSSLVSSILTTARTGSWGLFALAWRHKLAGVSDGFITNQSLWDRLVFDSARAHVLGHASAASLRAVVVSASANEARVDSETLTPARIALSVPLVNVTTHPLVAAPVLATHPLDLQDLSHVGENPHSHSHSHKEKEKKEKSRSGKAAHTGPPGVNVEVKLVGVDDEAVEKGSDPEGVVHVRGPPVGRKVSLEDYVHVSMSASVLGMGAAGNGGESEGWAETELRARVQANGSFVLL